MPSNLACVNDCKRVARGAHGLKLVLWHDDEGLASGECKTIGSSSGRATCQRFLSRRGERVGPGFALSRRWVRAEVKK